MAYPFESSIQLTNSACQLVFASGNSYISESPAGQLNIYAGSVNVMTLKSTGIALTTGAFVDTIETTLTNDDTHLPTSGAVFDAIITVGNQADNRIITATSVNNTLNGESALTFDGSHLSINSGGRIYLDNTDDTYIVESAANLISFVAGGTERLQVNNDGVHVVTPATSNVESGFKIEQNSDDAYGARMTWAKKRILVSVANDGDTIGEIRGYFNNDAATPQTLQGGRLELIVDDASDGTEDAHWSFWQMEAGIYTEYKLGVDFGAGAGDVSWGTATNKYVVFGSASGDIESNTDFFTDGNGNVTAHSSFQALLNGATANRGTYEYNRVQIYIGSVKRMDLDPNVADGASSIVYRFDSTNGMTTAGALLMSVRNLGTEKFSIDKDGIINVPTGGDYQINGVSIVGSGSSNVSVTNQGNDRIVTSTATTDVLNGESSFTYNVATGLNLAAATGVTGVIKIGGGPTITALDEISSELQFVCNDGSVTSDIGAKISVLSEATNGANQGLGFFTYTQTGDILSEKLRITNDGHLQTNASSQIRLGGVTNTYISGAVGGNFQVYVAGSIMMNVTSVVTFYQKINPNLPDTHDIGYSTGWWKDVYAQRYYVDDTSAYMSYSGTELQFTDAVSGTKTLAQLLAGSGGLSWSGSTANAIGTYGSSSTINAEAYLTFSGGATSTLNLDNSGTAYPIWFEHAGTSGWLQIGRYNDTYITLSGTLVTSDKAFHLGDTFTAQVTYHDYIHQISAVTSSGDVAAYVTVGNATSSGQAVGELVFCSTTSLEAHKRLGLIRVSRSTTATSGDMELFALNNGTFVKAQLNYLGHFGINGNASTTTDVALKMYRDTGQITMEAGRSTTWTYSTAGTIATEGLIFRPSSYQTSDYTNVYTYSNQWGGLQFRRGTTVWDFRVSYYDFMWRSGTTTAMSTRMQLGTTSCYMYGTSSFQLQLDAASSHCSIALQAGSTSDAIIYFRQDSTTRFIVGYDDTYDTFQIHSGSSFTTQASADFSISSAGLIYMGNLSATAGTYYMRWHSTTNLVTYTTSDIKFKKDLKPFEADALSALLTFEPKWFTWKETGVRQLGWIAQEGVEAIPAMFPYEKRIDAYAMDEFQVLPYFHKAIRQLHGVYKDHEDRIVELEQEVDKLKKQINL